MVASKQTINRVGPILCAPKCGLLWVPRAKCTIGAIITVLSGLQQLFELLTRPSVATSAVYVGFLAAKLPKTPHIQLGTGGAASRVLRKLFAIYLSKLQQKVKLHTYFNR